MYLFRKDLQTKKPVEINVPHKKVKLGLNESSLDPLSIVGSQFQRRMGDIPLNRYFNSVTAELYDKLADYAGVKKENLAFGNGADEMLYYIFTAVRESGQSFAASLAPTYFDYRSYCGAVGLGIRFLSLEKNFDFDLEKFIDLADDTNCRLIIICNPNNPTGNLFSDQKIISLIKENPNRLILIDETYFEFSGKTFAGMIDEYPNLVIVRSFSKAFSAAGLRFGYVISQPQNIIELTKVIPIFHLNLMTQALAASILDRKNQFLDFVWQIQKNKKIVQKELEEITELKVHSSATNFLTFSAGSQTEELFSYLAENDIAIRPVWHHPILNQHLRVTISGSSVENNLFLCKVAKFFAINKK